MWRYQWLDDANQNGSEEQRVEDAGLYEPDPTP